MTHDERLSAKALRYLNQQLAPQGLRVCTTHQGHPLPLDEAHFYPRGDGRFTHECKPCFRARSAEYGRKRYAADADYRARKCVKGRVWEGEALERKRRNAREWKRRKKAERLARILGGGT